jgi:hypothetical protein
MGTSTSQPSPATNAWRAVKAAYANPSISAERLSQLIWRAAMTQGDGDLGVQLQGLDVHDCLRATLTADSPSKAYAECSRILANSDAPSLANEFALQAAVVSFREESRAAGFALHLFSKATEYLASRDLPSLLQTEGRLTNAREVAALKSEIDATVRAHVESVKLPSKPTDKRQWRAFTEQVLSRLRQ